MKRIVTENVDFQIFFFFFGGGGAFAPTPQYRPELPMLTQHYLGTWMSDD